MNPTPTESAAPFPVEPISPDLLAWARQTFDMEEFLEGMREIEETGGVAFESFVAELEAKARGQ